MNQDLSSRHVLITGARAPVALHLARLLTEAGCTVVLADSMRRPVSEATRAKRAYVVLPPPRHDLPAFRAALAKAIADHDITDVIPTCEEVFYLGHIWQEAPLPARLHAPPMPLLREMHAKDSAIARIAAMGLPVPKTIRLTSSDEVEALRDRSRDLVFKPVWSRFGKSVEIRPEPARLRIAPNPAQPWIAQEALEGEEICVYALGQAGHLLAHAAYTTPYRAGAGAGVYMERYDDPAIAAFLQKVIAGTGWSGQISFDLMRLADGRLLPLECNPRTTSGLHFFSDGPAFARALFGGREITPDVTAPQTLPLALWLYGAPKALISGRFGRFRADARRAGHLLDWPHDPGPMRAQLRALSEIAMRALRQRTGLQAASTADIEWNGEPFQSVI